ncbi:hypothetical protein CALCODRAFT_463181 [Calocera cornea HHB12733]|uniref:Uncharacterized protein n=1 Tax=Calocera cornea HHB12733 TaxID=1353952 RepID=A0A165JQN5_9BASI|nr:hypothetical protein CALCODRAFT_463181 [Calocera cornea HHB12733]
MLHTLSRRIAFRITQCNRRRSTLSKDIEVDELGIPTKPTWSVQDQIAASPHSAISPKTLAHLHKLSALIAPAVGTQKYQKLKTELQNMVRLVEAVKEVDVSSVTVEGEVPDGRIWQTGRGMELKGYSPEETEIRAQDTKRGNKDEKMAEGTELLYHAERTIWRFYVVENDRER